MSYAWLFAWVAEGGARKVPLACSFSKNLRSLPHFYDFYRFFPCFANISLRFRFDFCLFFWEFWLIIFLFLFSLSVVSRLLTMFLVFVLFSDLFIVFIRFSRIPRSALTISHFFGGFRRSFFCFFFVFVFFADPQRFPLFRPFVVFVVFVRYLLRNMSYAWLFVWVVEGDARKAPLACSFSKNLRVHCSRFFIAFVRFSRISRSVLTISHF